MRGESERNQRRIKEGKKGETRNEKNKVRSEKGERNKAKENSDGPITTATRDKRKKRLKENIIRRVKIKRIKAATETSEGEMSELYLI
jgi:hypothetical protein